MMTGALAACLGRVPTPAATTPAATSPSPPTPTPIWFPPTATPTPLPQRSPTPTPNWFAEVGSVLLSENFGDAALWNTVTSAVGSVTVQRGRLVLAAQPGGYLVTYRRQPVLSDFYLEVTAELSLCRQDDLYGLLFRADGNNSYRYGLDCRGQVRLDRMQGNLRYPLQAPLVSGEVPPGSPGIVRLGVWARGREMRFFVNGHFQFQLSDGTLSNGSIGFFARPAADTPLTVSFTNLVVYGLLSKP